MIDFNFRQWLEVNIFGFEDNESFDKDASYHMAKKPLKGPQDLPIERMNVQRVIEELAKNDLGIKKGVISFFSECQWGSNPGAIRAIITPKINVKIQKLHHDMEGNKVWLMKKFFFIDDANFAGKEDVVALEIFDQVKKINDEQLEKPSKNIALEELTQALSSKMNALESHSLVPGHQVKKISENEYNLYYYLRGGGRTNYPGSGTTKNIMEVVVSLSSQKNTGLIKGMVTVVSNIDSGAKGGGTWVLIPSDFVEYFMPSQGKKEIIEAIMTALRNY
jgi:hypothetical protein